MYYLTIYYVIMKKPYKLALHLFRRDLRLVDNTALSAALQQAEQVIPCFIFDERQIQNNAYKSDNCIQFMMQSLHELHHAIKKQHGVLYYFNGIAEEIIAELLKEYPIDAVFINRDYTPFSRIRDERIANQCQLHDRQFHCFADALLHEPEEIVKADGKPYTVFTHAYRRAQELSVAKPSAQTKGDFYHLPLNGQNNDILTALQKYNNPHLLVKGGRTEGLSLIRNITSLGNYKTMRDIPSAGYTSHLSAHHKFGTVSIREVYDGVCAAFGKQHQLITELHWRDFFTHIGYFFPYVFGQPFHKKYAAIAWSQNSSHFQAWCDGLTGFPIVDAGMRELNTTGYMHNRVRMIVASFLTKDLHLDWRLGEKYFAQRLVDYDPAVNNGNWQWAASTGCDAQPYFRIFNPWLQQQKFDPECLYIKHWVPELADLSPKIIHDWAKNISLPLTRYPTPIVDHALASKQAKALYQAV